jgi:hypothetical protein
MSGKTKSAPGKRHFESTNPLAAPRSDEIRLAGMAMTRLLRKPSSSLGHTSRNVSIEIVSGSCHICDALTWDGSLSAVTTSTYTGTRKTHTKANSAR